MAERFWWSSGIPDAGWIEIGVDKGVGPLVRGFVYIPPAGQ